MIYLSYDGWTDCEPSKNEDPKPTAHYETIEYETVHESEHISSSHSSSFEDSYAFDDQYN